MGARSGVARATRDRSPASLIPVPVAACAMLALPDHCWTSVTPPAKILCAGATEPRRTASIQSRTRRAWKDSVVGGTD